MARTVVVRNPKGVMKSLERAIAAFPDLRIGQLVACATYESRHRTADPFYIEDTELIEALDRFVGTHAKKQS